MSTTKQDKSQGNSDKGLKLRMEKKKHWEKPGSVGGQFSSGQRTDSI